MSIRIISPYPKRRKGLLLKWHGFGQGTWLTVGIGKRYWLLGKWAKP